MKFVRFATLGVLSAAILLPAALACDLHTATNKTEAASYIESVQSCLANLPVEFQYDAEIEQDNFKRVNAARMERGLQPLQLRADLVDAARWHSFDMAANAFFAHRGQDSRTHDKRISLLDRSLIYDASRENIAMMRGQYQSGIESKTLHTGLMESQGHYENIMADNVSHMAVGVVRRKDGVWLTQLFVNEAGELSVPAPVRLMPGQTLALDARLNGWMFSGFQAEQGRKLKKFKTTRKEGKPITPSDLSGDIVLGIRGERRATSDNPQAYYINLSGPSVTVVASNRPAITRISSERRVTKTAQPSPGAS